MFKKVLMFVLFSKTMFLFGQIYSLTVNNGYGSGSYTAGDTVHVFSIAYDTTETFGSWTGDVEFMQNMNEWHTTLVMPSEDIFVSAQIFEMPDYNLERDVIHGYNSDKRVFYHFPENLEGVVWLFHGTGGSADGWAYKTEGRSLVDALIYENLGVIITEAEEITLNTDLNGDGKLRWQSLPPDTLVGIDFLNIIAIRDTLMNRGFYDFSTPQFSIGMSNGGAFSSVVASLFSFDAGVSYCASGLYAVFNQMESPFAFRMALYDDNEEVGPEGNYQAFQHDSLLQVNGICHDYLIHDRQPIYPERFARINGISVSESVNIFNDLVTNGHLDANNYAEYSNDIYNAVLSVPNNYPSIISIPAALRNDVLLQISAANAEHTFYSDYNYETISFIKNICSSTGIYSSESNIINDLLAFPNPFKDYISVVGAESPNKILVTDIAGKIFLKAEDQNILDLTFLSEGVYFLSLMQNNSVNIIKIIKQ